MLFPCMNDPDSLFHLALEQPQVVTTGSKILTHDESIKWHSEVQHSEFIYRSFLISTWKSFKLDLERIACFLSKLRRFWRHIEGREMILFKMWDICWRIVWKSLMKNFVWKQCSMMNIFGQNKFQHVLISQFTKQFIIV